MTTRREAMGVLMKASLACTAMFTAGCAGVPVPSVNESITLMLEADELYKARRYDEAIAKYRAVIARDPLNWRAWLGLAKSFIARGLWRDAIDSGKRAFELSPQGPDVLSTFLQALFGGGMEALNAGQFTDSIKHFTEYLRHNSTGAAWLNVGKAYLGNRQFGEAFKSLVNTMGLADADRSDVVRTIFSGGQQAFNARDYSSAINLMREYVRQDPRNLQAYLTLAKSYWETGQRGNAFSAVTEVLRIAPTNGEALQLLPKLR